MIYDVICCAPREATEKVEPSGVSMRWIIEETFRRVSIRLSFFRNNTRHSREFEVWVFSDERWGIPSNFRSEFVQKQRDAIRSASEKLQPQTASTPTWILRKVWTQDSQDSNQKNFTPDRIDSDMDSQKLKFEVKEQLGVRCCAPPRLAKDELLDFQVPTGPSELHAQTSSTTTWKLPSASRPNFFMKT